MKALRKVKTYTQACHDRNFCKPRGEGSRVVVSLTKRSRDYLLCLEIEANLLFEALPLRG